MRCIVPACGSCDSDSDCITKDVTFHPIPRKPTARAEWFKVLNMGLLEVAEDSAVCSKHFLKGDLYINRSGVCKMRAGALPIVNLQNLPMSEISDLKVCRICFGTDCKLYKMTEYNNLDEAYKILTGILIEKEDKLPLYLCFECTQRLQNCIKFRSRSLHSHLTLLEIVRKHEHITLQSMKSFIGNEGPHGSRLKVTQTSHYDLKINHVKEENEETEEQVDQMDNVITIKAEKDDTFDINISREDTVNVHVGYIPHLHEDYDIKMDTEDSISQHVNDEDIANDTEYLPRSNYDNIGKDMTEENKEEGSISKINKDVIKDNLNIDFVVKDMVGNDEVDDFLLIVKKTSKDVNKRIENKEQSPFKGKSRRYNTRNHYRQLTDKLIIKSGPTKPNRPIVSEELCPTNIVKLRKRVPVTSRASEKNKKYDKFIYRTVSDVPLWGRLKTNTAIKPFSCNVCNFKTGYKKELKIHEKTHCTEKPQQLDVCVKTDGQSDSGGKLFSCDVCNQEFDNKNQLYRHIAITSGGKPYSCQICKKQFKFISQLDVHNKKHLVKKPYSCDVCKKTFNFETSLTLHTKRLHPNKSGQKKTKM